MIKYIFPDGRYAYHTLHRVNGIVRSEDGRLMARAMEDDGTVEEFEIKGFELVRKGALYQ